MIQKLSLSLATKLIIFFTIAAAILTLLASIFLGKGLSRHFQENIFPLLNSHINYIQTEIGIPPDIDKAAEIASRMPLQIHIFGDDMQWASNGKPINPAEIKRRPRRFPLPGHRLRHPNVMPGLINGNLVIKNSTKGFDFYYVLEKTSGDRHIGFFGWLLLASVVAVFALTYFYTRWLFKPISAIHECVARIGNGQLGKKIVTERSDELGDLANNINLMSKRIESMLNAKRELLLAISHELRSPITRAKVNLALMEPQANTRLINDDLNEMEHLITELLESERLNTQHVALHRQSVAINTLITELIEVSKWEQPIETNLNASHDVLMNVDVTRIRLLLKNVLENALRYNRQQIASVTLNTSVDQGRLLIRIKDFGTGIDAEHIPHLTEAFYRSDPARQRETGGFGLGLYLCRLITEAHGGTITINSEVNQWTCVEISLPIVEAKT